MNAATSSGGAAGALRDVTAAMLRDWPLPMPGAHADKEVRGHVLIVAGSPEMPGAVLLAATAALRAGAGKLTIATAASVSAALGVALPEARVIGLAETPDGGLLAGPAADGAAIVPSLQQACERACAILIGPGMQDQAACTALVTALLPCCGTTPVILDAGAMCVAGGDDGMRFATPVLLTPHAGELAGLSGADKQAIADDPHAAAHAATQRLNAVVALKGATTVITAPTGETWSHTGGNTGLAISGSGDVLAGLIAGLAARGAALEQAAAWGVALHALAGEQLSLRHGPHGYLAREISAEVPALLRALSAH
ncbi:carbohydrate kinase [Duganella sp. Leaf126]|uniref:NAD(P)H-hydrate dehydratase n=1 Tax=Duganella sp. Leaf126 TaxID=1736266 RepID=UPI00070155ED|nr:NAD(P)H-hydrate dehydratase [Duganella sp. Leaf126]KQQ36073.1 carbohydrate kinase [Duganella sp. Leaf126]